jgi:hypothetical protein
MLNGINTFVLLNIPDIVLYFDPASQTVPLLVVTAMQLSRGLLSTAIFVTRHRELRFAFLRCVGRMKNVNKVSTIL